MKIKEFFRELPKKVWELFKKFIKLTYTRTFLILAFIFTWILPLIMLNEKIAFTQTVTTTWKLTFFGVIVVAFCAIKFYKKIANKIDAMKPIKVSQFILQIVLIIIHKVITFGVIALLLFYFGTFLSLFVEWYKYALISFAIGVICNIIDRVIVFARKNKIGGSSSEEQI